MADERVQKLEKALDLLIEAVECNQQGYRLSGMVTAESPGGQTTALRRDGTPVARHDFMKSALMLAKQTLNDPCDTCGRRGSWS